MDKNIDNQWFKVVEIEVNSRCNLKCSYCPNSILPTPDVPEYMSDEVFERIINELIKINFSGRVSYHFYGEPLLRKDLERLVAQIKEKLPNVYQLLFTNGIFLSEERYINLKKAGIDHFLVTLHDNITSIPERPYQSIRLPKDIMLSNRGGTLFKRKNTLHLPCYAPSKHLIVTVNGNLLLCGDDAKRCIKTGNIIEQSIEDVWFSEKFIKVRELLKNGQRDIASAICKYCDNKEHYDNIDRKQNYPALV